MQWLVWLLPIASGGLDASSRVVIKITNVNKFLLAGFGFLFAVPWYLMWLFVQGVPAIHSGLWLAVAGVVPIGIIASLLTIEAHRRSPFILTAPYLSLTPAFLLITSPLMGGGIPTSIGIVGILVTVMGVYVLNCSHGNVSFLQPFRSLFEERGSMYMVIVSFLFAITTNLDFIGILNANVAVYMTINHGLLGISNLALGAFFYRKEKVSAFVPAFKKSLWAFVAYGAFIGIQMILHMTAFQWIPSVPYVISAKRVGAVLLTVIVGVVLSLWGRAKDKHQEERKDFIFRLIGICMMLFGMVLVIFYGKAF